MRKTVIDPDVGERIDAFERSDRVEGLVHSNGVAVETPHSTRVYVSGIVSIDEEENVVGPNDVEVQTRTVLERIETYLAEFGGDMNDVVRVRVYTDGVDEEDFLTIHEVRSEFFEKEHYPASTLFEVEELAFDELVVEIDADAVIPDDGWETGAVRF